MSRLPFRWRLTLWYGALLGLALLAFCALLYGGLQWRLTALFDEQLRDQAELTLSSTTFANGQLQLDTGNAVPGEEEYFLRLVDQQGEVITERGMPPADTASADAAVVSALGGNERLVDLDAAGDVRLRLLTIPVRIPGDDTIRGALQIGLDRTDLDETMTQVLLALVILVPLVLATAVIGGYVLAGRLLQPLAQVTGLARAMGEHALHERLNLDLPDDELGRLADTFDAMLGRIESAFLRQRQFTADAAHELRTPLSLMRSRVDLARSRPRTLHEYEATLRDLDSDLSRLTDLAQALLALGRLERADALDRQRFDIAETIAATAGTYEPALAQAGITLRLETTPAAVDGDEDTIIQVLVNLLDNAIAYTPPGGTITIGSQPASDTVEVRVVDTGAGIAVADQPRVFDRFYRPDAGRTRDRGGTGLGLAICKAIVEAHGGEITLESVPGAGTTVAFTLPNAGHGPDIP